MLQKPLCELCLTNKGKKPSKTKKYLNYCVSVISQNKRPLSNYNVPVKTWQLPSQYTHTH